MATTGLDLLIIKIVLALDTISDRILRLTIITGLGPELEQLPIALIQLFPYLDSSILNVLIVTIVI